MPSDTNYETRLNHAIDKLQHELELARALSSNEILLVVVACILWCFILGLIAATCCILPCYRQWLRLQEPPDTPPEVETASAPLQETDEESTRESDDWLEDAGLKGPRFLKADYGPVAGQSRRKRRAGRDLSKPPRSG